MKKFELHPYCTLFPACTEEELQALIEDIRQNGLLVPIVLLDEKILDGRNRYEACQELGIEPETVEYKGGDPLGFVISKNLHRRHLNESQRAMIASEIANLQHGGNNRKQPANLPVANSLQDKELGEGGGFSASLPQVTQAEAAKMLNVSERSVRTATKIKKEASPEVIQQVKEGKKSLHAAHSEHKPKQNGKPRRQTVAESQEPEDQVEYLKIPLPIEHFEMASVFGRRFQSESDEVKEQVLREIDLFHAVIQNLRCD